MKRKTKTCLILLLAFLPVVWSSCNKMTPEESEKAENSKNIQEKEISNWNSMIVTATAYNSLPGQGEGNVEITSWGDTLKPGNRSIAVSRDLIKKGLSYETKVKIEGLEGVFVVNDKMNSRWKNKIDIYMGENRSKALEWGKRKVEICFPSEELQNNSIKSNYEK